MSFCPFISTPTNKKTPSNINCSECYFYVGEPQTRTKYCAILLAAERAVNATEILQKAFPEICDK